MMFNDFINKPVLGILDGQLSKINAAIFGENEMISSYLKTIDESKLKLIELNAAKLEYENTIAKIKEMENDISTQT